MYIAAQDFLGEIQRSQRRSISCFPDAAKVCLIAIKCQGDEMLNAFRGIYWAWKGKAFGNQVADLLGIHRGLYHGAMEEGGCQLHLIKLYHLKQDGESLEHVALHSCDYLLPGLAKLEDRFGPQMLIAQAKSRVGEFYNRFGKDW